jgi:hypothetical protein
MTVVGRRGSEVMGIAVACAALALAGATTLSCGDEASTTSTSTGTAGTSAQGGQGGQGGQASTCNLLTDTNVHPVDGYPTTRPDYLVPYLDPVFGSKITRVVKDEWTATDGYCRHHYSKDQAWNADGTLLWLNKGCDGGKFLDGNTYVELPEITSPTSEARWHPTDPDVLIFIANNQLTRRNVRTDANTVLRSFAGYTDLVIGNGEGNLSRDGDRIVLLDYGGALVPSVAFAYDMATDVKHPDNLLDQGFGSVTISPSGSYVVYFYPFDSRRWAWG